MFKKFQAAYQFGKTVAKQLKGNKSKVSPTITKVEPSVAKTKKQKLVSELKKTTQRVKGATAKLKQTQFERANPKFKGEDFTFATRVGRSSKVRDKKMGGGFMGKRMGYSKGTPKPDFLDLDKDGNTSEPMKQAAKQAKRKK